MRRIALLCSLIVGPLTGLPGCLEAQHGGQGADAKSTSQPLETIPPPDTTPTAPPDTTPTAHSTDTTPTSPPDTDVPPDTTPQCLAANAECANGSACCAGLTCIWQPDHYTLALCQPRAADGGACFADDGCVSGHCIDGLCGQLPECANEGTGCMMQSACCAGLVCTGGPYAFGECITKQPLHAYCEDNRWCSSGVCADGECVNPHCVANGTPCESTECCSGLCLFPTNSYGPAVCTAPQPAGAWCSYDAMCASGTCADAECAAPTCVARGDECWHDAACCAGDFCTQHGQSYVVGTCLRKRVDGNECEVDSWCRNGHCIDGFCRTP